jgi:hypothetical protein
VRHELQRVAHRRAVGRAAEADADGFGGRALGREGVACDHADAGRAHVADEGGAGPGLRQRHPQVEADRVGADAAAGQDFR